MKKYKIECTLTVLTGLHIGDNTGFAPIGAMDNPVIRDAFTGDPYIPGSSLKGKMRTLLAKARMPEGKYILPDCSHDDPVIQRVFGSPADKDNRPLAARMQFTDAFLINRDELIRIGGTTESKSENSIDRKTSVANPRPMERVVRGAKFKIVWQYSCVDEKEMKEDLLLLSEGCKLLSVDYLGGCGSRGSGRVGFDGFKVTGIYPEKKDMPELAEYFKDVNSYAVQNM